jgi:hypothetical protein
LGTRRTKEYGAYSYMLMNFDLVKWRLASLRHMQQAAGSYTRAKRRHADAIKKFDILLVIAGGCESERNLTKISIFSQEPVSIFYPPKRRLKGFSLQSGLKKVFIKI